MPNPTRPWLICKLDDCLRPPAKAGICWMHRKRIQREGGELAALNIPTPLQRLEHYGWNVTETGCWEFAGQLDGRGYGRVSRGSYGAPRAAAHRLSYETHHGPIPEGLHICHTCDNPPCINPAHLWAGTHQDNMRDKVAKGRHRGWRKS